MKCPPLSETLIIADSAQLAAQASCVFQNPKTYLPLLDGPRLTRPDAEHEIVRRNNVAAKLTPKRIVFAGLSTTSDNAFQDRFPQSKILRMQTGDDFAAYRQQHARSAGRTLKWGSDNIGLGVLEALRSNALIEFDDGHSSNVTIPSKTNHLVICEAGEQLSEVIAANYAYSIGAGLHIIPAIPETTNNELMERFYSLYETNESGFSPTHQLEELQGEFRKMCGSVDVRHGMSLTIISKELPLGFGFPEVPSTHLFNYPDLGISVSNGFIAEQSRMRGTNVSVLIDPQTTEAPEIGTIAKTMSQRRSFVRGYSGRGATVRNVSDAVELFPYDLLVFATHCGDASGYRWTYEFEDSEGLHRELVVDIAVGIATTRDDNMLDVVQFMRFHKLDGVDWNDPDKSDKLYVGTAMKDFAERTRSSDEMEPTKKENIPRVLGSAALRMFDANYLVLPSSLASNGTPIVINNACGSWHSLAGRFVFAGARTYVGTLFPVTTNEAHDVSTNVFNQQWGKTVAHAFWSAQNRVYGDSARRPYIVTGIYPSKIRVTHEDAPRHIASKLRNGLSSANSMKREGERTQNKFLSRKATEAQEYYLRELRHTVKQYGIKN
jgi:hypothetical protein